MALLLHCLGGLPTSFRVRRRSGHPSRRCSIARSSQLGCSITNRLAHGCRVGSRFHRGMAPRAGDGGGGGGGASAADAVDKERSTMANEELVLFLFQLQLDQEMQRAMTYENFQTAMEIRERRKQVDKAVETLEEVKGLGSGAKGSGQKDVMDATTQGLQIRSEMQKAVEEERYDDAAKFRDQLLELENQTKEAEASIDLVSVDPALRLGQRVLHKDLGYRGVICGWDVLCCETDDWKLRAGLDSLQFGAEQIFYYVIVDERDWNSPGMPPVAYVAEETLTCPEMENQSTWIEVYGKDDEFLHPYSIWLFLGKDARGDYIPCSQLRDKYSVERWDVYPPGEDGYSDDDDDGGGDDDGSRGGGGGDVGGGGGGNAGPSDGNPVFKFPKLDL